MSEERKTLETTNVLSRREQSIRNDIELDVIRSADLDDSTKQLIYLESTLDLGFRLKAIQNDQLNVSFRIESLLKQQLEVQRDQLKQLKIRVV